MKQIISEESESRINILRHIFGMDRYKQIKENLSILLTDLKSNQKIYQGETYDLESERSYIMQKEAELILLKETSKNENKRLDSKKSEKIALEEEIEKLKKRIEEINFFEKEIEKTKIFITTKKEFVISLTKESYEIKKMFEEYPEQFDEDKYLYLIVKIKEKKILLEELNSQLMQLSGKNQSLNYEANNLIEVKERIFGIEMCPTCLQNVSDTHKHNILNETENKLSKIKKDSLNLTEEENSILSEMKKVKIEIAELEEKKVFFEILKSKLQEMIKSKEKQNQVEKQIKFLNSDIEILGNHIDGLKEKILKNSSFQFIFKKKEAELRQKFLEEKSIEISIAELRKEIELIGRDISLLKKKVEDKEEKRKKLRNLEEITNWLSNSFLNLIETIETNVMIKIRAEFSSLFRKWFLMLVPDNSLESHVDENFTPIIMQGENEIDYPYLSGGERTAVALAYRLALNQTINSFLSKIKTQGIIILDEPTDGFSETQITKMRDIFEELNVAQLIIVSHEQKIESFVDNIIRIVKDLDTSSVQHSSLEVPQREC